MGFMGWVRFAWKDPTCRFLLILYGAMLPIWAWGIACSYTSRVTVTAGQAFECHAKGAP